MANDAAKDNAAPDAIKRLDAIAAEFGDDNVISKASRDSWITEGPPLPKQRDQFDPDPRPTLGTATLERMLVDIANGEPKPADLTPDENDMWNNLVKEVREIRARGGQIDIPYEAP